MDINNIIESAELRNELIGKVDVLDKIKKLVVMPNTDVTTIKQVAAFYEVDEKTIEKVTERNTCELIKNGGRLYKQKEVIEMLTDGENEVDIIATAGIKTVHTKQGSLIVPNRGLKLFSRKSVLLIGILLRDSHIADRVKIALNVYLPRKELSLRRQLDSYIDLLKSEYKKRRRELYSNSSVDTQVFDYVSQFTIGQHRVDIYFPYMNLVLEYDEMYHQTEKQTKIDDRRTHKILYEFKKKEVGSEWYGYGKDENETGEITYTQFIDDCSNYIDFDLIGEYRCCKDMVIDKENVYNSYCNVCDILDISKIKGLTKVLRVNENKEEQGLLVLISYLMSELKGF